MQSIDTESGTCAAACFCLLSGRPALINTPNLLSPLQQPAEGLRSRASVFWKRVSLTAKGKYEYWITPEGLLKIEGWARDGLKDEQIAGNIGIRRQTLYEWTKRFPVIFDTLKRGKEIVDRQVENALLKRALGYEYDEVTREPDMNGEMVETKRVTKQVLPDTTAQIFWLKNRKPDEWRDKQNINVTTEKHEKLDAILSQIGGEGLEE